MIKGILSLTCFLFSYCASTAQSQVQYLEVTANYESGSGDSTQRLVTFVVSVMDYNATDSLTLSLKDREGQVIYQSINSLSAWVGGYPNRMEGSTLYLTIELGSYSQIEKFEGEAHTLVNGSPVPGKSFIKESL
jgi:hypothetical protein